MLSKTPYLIQLSSSPRGACFSPPEVLTPGCYSTTTTAIYVLVQLVFFNKCTCPKYKFCSSVSVRVTREIWKLNMSACMRLVSDLFLQ